jgi:hypothetical protein
MIRSDCVCWCVAVLLGIVFLFPDPLQAADTGNEVISIDTDAISENLPSDEPVPVNRVLAIVDDQVITMSDYRAEYGDTVLTYGRLEPLIDRSLILAESADRKISLPEGRLDRLVERQVSRMKQAPGGLERMLRSRGLTEENFREGLRQRIKTRFLESRVLTRMYPQVQDGDTQSALVSVRARLMYVDNLRQAWRLYGWLQAQPTQETWNRLYENYSRKLGLMGEHGDLGWFQWGQYNRTIEYEVFKSPLYTVSHPFALRDGYAMIYPTGYRLDPAIDNPSRAIKVFKRYRRRFYVDRMYERLRREQSVIIPTSVQDRLSG